MTTSDNLDQRVRDSFAQITVPDEVNQATLAFIREYGEKQPAIKVRPQRTLRRWLALAACLIVLVTLVGGYNLWMRPTALLDIDVNPSISLEVNCFNYVIAATPLNEDAQSVLEQTPVVGKSCEAALEALAQSPALTIYSSSDALAEISVASDNETQSNQLCDLAQDTFAPLFAQVSPTHVTFDEMQTAHGHHMGAGKYRAACRLMELDDTATLESCAEMSVSEIHSCINECQHGEGHGRHNGQGQGQGQGHGRHRQAS